MGWFSKKAREPDGYLALVKGDGQYAVLVGTHENLYKLGLLVNTATKSELEADEMHVLARLERAPSSLNPDAVKVWVVDANLGDIPNGEVPWTSQAAVRNVMSLVEGMGHDGVLVRAKIDVRRFGSVIYTHLDMNLEDHSRPEIEEVYQWRRAGNPS